MKALSLSFVFGLLAPAVVAQTVTLTLDTSQMTPISPLIYGTNFATQAQATALNLPINRSGGNANTRYNWEEDSTSSASDWYYLSHPNGDGTPSGSVDSWITANNNSGVGTKSMISIPLIGWVAKTFGGFTWSYSVAAYGAQQATEPWHPDAGNGIRTNGTQITGNNPNDANKPVTISYQQPWLTHLISIFGTASTSTGVAYYLLDNEPSLWNETHRDVMPIGVTMNDLFVRGRDAAIMVKNLDPAAQVVGPEEWGWLGYLYSGYDLQWLRDHNWQGNPPDRASHGNLDCAAYQLQQFAAASASAGKRLLDVFALHYYPQGNYGGGDTSDAATLWRNRSTRSLWDPNYTDESWINQKINLIPRMKNWVNTYYPGTKIGITEYNFGDDTNMAAAIAQADVLGIFGRERVDLATRWVCPTTNSMSFKAMQMYRNYNGARGTFGNYSLPLPAPDPDTLSSFGSYDSTTGQYKVMLVHKRKTGTASVNLKLPNLGKMSKAQVWRLSSPAGIQKRPDIAGVNGTLALTLPAQSVTLVIFRTMKVGPT